MELKAHDLHSGYGRLTVLRGLDFEVAPGQLVAVLGPNGAGKTTLLRTFTGMLPVRSGSLTLDGKAVTKSSWTPAKASAAGVGYVPQTGNVFADLSVAENLALSQTSDRGKASHLDSVYDRFPVLKDRASQTAGSLSGGERQALAVSMAFVAQPKLMLLDEPTTGLSPLASQALLDWIVELVQQGTGVVWVVEQNPQPVLDNAAFVYVLDGGQVVASGPSTQFSGSQAMALVFRGDRQQADRREKE